MKEFINQGNNDTRSGFGAGLLELGKSNHNIVALCADLCKLINKERGFFDSNDVLNSINPPDFYHSPKTSLVCVENTTNKGGGACWDINELKKIQLVCKENKLKYHLDGARIWNASVKNGIDFSFFGEIFDTISVCLSKSLGCPVGSLLLCNEKDYNEAVRIRKILGSYMSVKMEFLEL